MKQKLPWDVKQECLWIVRGYDRRVKAYHQMRQDIIDEGGAHYTTYVHADSIKDLRTGEVVVKREERRSFAPRSMNIGRPVEEKQARLEAVEHYPETKKMRAVEHAKSMVGLDVANNEVQQRLMQSVILNCKDGRRYTFEHLNLSEFSRSDFYRRRDEFLFEIARFLIMI